jgi:hypothetical protein
MELREYMHNMIKNGDSGLSKMADKGARDVSLHSDLIFMIPIHPSRLKLTFPCSSTWPNNSPATLTY